MWGRLGSSWVAFIPKSPLNTLEPTPSEGARGYWGLLLRGLQPQHQFITVTPEW